jgi:hypothetical protein
MKTMIVALLCGVMAVPVFAGERSRVRTATSSCNACQPATTQESVVRTRTKVRAKCNCESNCACDQGVACACDKAERKVVRKRSVTRSTCLTCN